MNTGESRKLQISVALLAAVVLCLMGWISHLQTQMTKIQDVQGRADHRSQMLYHLQSRSRRSASSGQRGGAIYVRWGRTECPLTNTDLVYEGIMAGKHYSHKGGGVNYLCMARKPQWLKTKAGVQGSSYMYGVEYEANTWGQEYLFSHTNAESIHNHDAVCAVCRSNEAVTQVMIPGKISCEKGWTREYYGYLMAAHAGHVGETEFVCVDHAPETDYGGSQNHDGGLLYFVEAMCGSLPCPRYKQGSEISCVVCTK